jgi:cytochrome b6-f complex iron-sulfur subunit
MADSGMQFRNISRREFLNYVWVGSLAIFMAATGGAMLAFAMPRFGEGEFGGMYTVGTVSETAYARLGPGQLPDLRFWLNVAKKPLKAAGFKASWRFIRCAHLLVYAWVDSTVRFECPCHGSKYQECNYIEPSQRDLDGSRGDHRSIGNTGD